jgi:hypothetical protein
MSSAYLYTVVPFIPVIAVHTLAAVCADAGTDDG